MPFAGQNRQKKERSAYEKAKDKGVAFSNAYCGDDIIADVGNILCC